MKCVTNSAQGTLSIDTKPLGKGGEGSVFSVLQHNVDGLDKASELVAKIYHVPEDGDRENKIKAMLASPPDSTAVAWPLGIVYDDSNKFAGYVMVKLPMDKYKSWAELSHVGDRRKTSPDFDVRYAITASRNLGAAIDSIHNAGHIVGDVNESNILIAPDAQVMIVDTDSAQISTKSGKVYPCLVGKPDYTAPEISHGSLRDHQRTIATDVFAYCVTVFMMLTGGAHPTNAIFSGAGDPPKMIDKMRKGIYPGLVNVPNEFSPVPRIPVKALPKVFKNIFAKGLSVDPTGRPSLKNIIKVEDILLSNTTQCQKNPLHWFDKREGSCPWCIHAKKNNDPWTPEAEIPKNIQASNVKQKSLPAVGFNNASKKPFVAQRKPVVTNGHSPASGINPARQAPSPQRPTVGGTPMGSNNSGVQSPVSHSVTPPTAQGRQKPQALYDPPEKHKGKMVLTNAMGKIQRPPLGELFRQNPKLAMAAFFHEMPSAIKPWWPNYRPFPSLAGTILGILVGLGLACGWLIAVPMIVASSGFLKYDFVEQALPYATLASFYTAIAFVAVFGISALSKVSQSRKYKHLKPYGFLTTLGFFVAVGLFYGLGFILIVVVALLGSVIGKVADNLTKKTQRR